MLRKNSGGWKTSVLSQSFKLINEPTIFEFIHTVSKSEMNVKVSNPVGDSEDAWIKKVSLGRVSYSNRYLPVERAKIFAIVTWNCPSSPT